MISVITPSYNYGHLISETIRSVQQQSYTDWEMIIVDDGSTDNTIDVVESLMKMDKRIRFYQQKNAGPSAARNLALSHAGGDYIQFLDADDIIESKKFEIQIQIFNAKKETDLVYGNVRYFTEDPYDKNEWLYSYWGEDKEWLPKLNGRGVDLLVPALKGGLAHISTYLFRTELLKKVDKWDTGKRAAEDTLYLLNCFLAGANIIYHDAPDTYALVRWHANNVSRNTKWIREGDILMRIELRPRLKILGRPEIVKANEEAIKSLSIMVKGGWRSKFLSGGPFDFLKRTLSFFGLEKIARRIFYRH